MPANTAPIFTLTPKIGYVVITTAAANIKSDGAGTVGTDIFLAFSAGSNGSYLDRIRFLAVASAAAVSSQATTLRVFLSTVNTGSTTSANTYLISEISVPIVAAAHSTNSAGYFEIAIGFAIPASTYVLVSQHLAQTTNQEWVAVVVGGDY